MVNKLDGRYLASKGYKTRQDISISTFNDTTKIGTTTLHRKAYQSRHRYRHLSLTRSSYHVSPHFVLS